MSTITAYEIEDIGIDHVQYFSGRSTHNTDWHNVVIGVGGDPIDAFDNAMQQLVDDDYMIDPIVEQERALYYYATHPENLPASTAFSFTPLWSEKDMHQEGCPALEDEAADCDSMCEYMYYIAIYVR